MLITKNLVAQQRNSNNQNGAKDFIQPIGQTLPAFLPLLKVKVTSDFGMRLHPFFHKRMIHTGADLRADFVPVFAFSDGVVASEGYDNRSGNYMVLDHGSDSLQSVYCHLSAFLVPPGDTVMGGELIAISGESGMCTAPHLHFALKVNGHFINPLPVLKYLVFFYHVAKKSDNNIARR